MRAAHWLAAGLLLSLFARSARADDLAQAKANFAVGARAYDQRKFRLAVDAFQASYQLAPHAAILFSIAQAHKRLYFAEHADADLRQALTYYRRYVKDEPDGRRVEEASTSISDLEAVAARKGISLTEDVAPSVPDVAAPARLLISTAINSATARIDDGSPVELPSRIETTPGKHRVTIEAAGYVPYTTEVVLQPGEPYPLDAPMVQLPARLTVPLEDGTRIYVDGRLVATTPVARPLEVPPGERNLSFARKGSDPLSMTVKLAPGEARAVSADLRTSDQRTGSYACFAIGGGLAIGGGVLAGFAVARQNRALAITSKESNITPSERAEQTRAGEDRDLYRGLAVGGFSGAGVLATTGLLLYLLDNAEPQATNQAPAQPDEKRPFDLSVGLDFSPSFGMAMVGASF
jgi:hypothetical protein